MRGEGKRKSNNDSASGCLVRSVLRALPASVVVAIVTFICFGLHVKFPTVSLLYLIVVVLQSLVGDFLSSTFVSFLSFLCLNYFFVPPIFSFSVSDASDTVALISFLIAGLVITRLTSQIHEAAEAEELQRKEMTRLYKISRQLLALEPTGTVDANLLRPFRSEFDLRAVSVFDAATTQLHTEGNSLNRLPESTRNAYIAGRDFNDDSCGVTIRLLRVGSHTIGAIGFEGLGKFELLADPLAALATILIEQRHAFERASRSAAATEAEMFRGAMLDALAHELKTPLATIVLAAGGIRAAGPLLHAQEELAQTVEEEASRLGHLTTRLLRLARLDREEVKPQMELTDIRDLVSSVVVQYSRRWPDRRLSLIANERIDAAVDRELLWLGCAQLLDNACKYSPPLSDITVSLDNASQRLAIRVWNSGTSIAASEQTRIFERFYRGTEAKNVPGSGLGLYVARKIAVAHGGMLELEHSECGEGIAFRLVIPHSKSELDHDTEIQCTSRR
jgi:two-component system sensor histidine kinase KdpD